MNGVEELGSDRAYKLQNLYEASYLLCMGFSLIGKIKNGNKYSLMFERTPEIEEESLRFYNGAKAEAKKLFDSYRTLKDYIFER